MITTARLELVPATTELLRAEQEGKAALAAALDAQVAPSWPPPLHDSSAVKFTLQRLARSQEDAGWWLHYILLRESRELVGAGGYKGPPDSTGTIELGYSILPEFRRRGYATEAVAGLVDHGFRDPRVAQAVAETLPELVGSIGVLQGAGFRYVGAGSEVGLIRYERRRLAAKSS